MSECDIRGMARGRAGARPANWPAPAASRRTARSGDGRGADGVAGAHPGGQRRGRGGGPGRRPDGRLRGSPDADRAADRGHGPRGAADRRSPRPGGGDHRHVAPAQRPAGGAHAGAPGRDRDHLRVPAQRDRGRRGAVPQVRERRAAARRVGGAPHQPRHRRRPVGRGGLGGAAGGVPRRRALGGPGRGARRCSRSTASST